MPTVNGQRRQSIHTRGDGFRMPSCPEALAAAAVQAATRSASAPKSVLIGGRGGCGRRWPGSKAVKYRMDGTIVTDGDRPRDFAQSVGGGRRQRRFPPSPSAPRSAPPSPSAVKRRAGAMTPTMSR